MTQHALGAIHGRFQPFHKGHLEYLICALDRASKVIVGVTSPQRLEPRESTDDHRHLGQNNPFTYFERLDMITTSVWRHDPSLLARIRVVPFDLTAPNWQDVIPAHAVQLVTPHEAWDLEKADRFRGAGYLVEHLALNPDRINASRIRSLFDADDQSWRDLVPPGCAEALEQAFGNKNWRARRDGR